MDSLCCIRNKTVYVFSWRTFSLFHMRHFYLLHLVICSISIVSIIFGGIDAFVKSNLSATLTNIFFSSRRPMQLQMASNCLSVVRAHFTNDFSNEIQTRRNSYSALSPVVSKYSILLNIRYPNTTHPRLWVRHLVQRKIENPTGIRPYDIYKTCSRRKTPNIKPGHICWNRPIPIFDQSAKAIPA